MSKAVLAVHGGAGVIRKGMLEPAQEQAYHAALATALQAGYAILNQGGTWCRWHTQSGAGSAGGDGTL